MGFCPALHENTSAAVQKAPHQSPPCVKGGGAACRAGGIDRAQRDEIKCGGSPGVDNPSGRCAASSLYTRGSRINPGANISFEGGPCPLELPRCSIVGTRSRERSCGRDRRRAGRDFCGDRCGAAAGLGGGRQSLRPLRGQLPLHKGLPDKSGSQDLIRGRALPPRAPPLLWNRSIVRMTKARRKSLLPFCSFRKKPAPAGAVNAPPCSVTTPTTPQSIFGGCHGLHT